MKANRLDDVVYTNKSLPAEKMKDYFMHVGKYITDLVMQEGKFYVLFV